ncbi:TetR/AcrR family transcriptional regulator [Sphaerisporangium siamense]|uniref:AcrR family transcriptional regulator n=1 Tax=Sphaerisporangium siamense TaxID=795645 RepID=A0A7W7D679_9ACTN|nr:TetR/AcrR family transcriptional regulator [Sphaerisporangium siamense]MBB4699678.1 AcrR family transcriptional regulator [Sphaerisporangium siamense]
MNEKSRDDLPRSLEALWKGRERRPRGPAQALSLPRIVDAAIALADEEGLPALSMARLAQRLGCATMSLYRHVAGKDELQLLMADAASTPAPRIEPGPGGWRAGLGRWALEMLGVYHRHPWILQITGGPPLDPGQLAWVDAGLRTLRDTPLSPREKLSALMLVMYYTRGHAQIWARPPWQPAEALTDEAAYETLLTRLVDAERFPDLAEAIAGGAFAPEPDAAPEAGFTAGLDRILDGIDTLIGHRDPEYRTSPDTDYKTSE